MRNKLQAAKRLERIKIANDLLGWLEQKMEFRGAPGSPLRDGGGAMGSHAWESIIKPFSEEKGLKTYEVWKAWDILKETGRREIQPGIRWTVNNFNLIEADLWR